MLLPKSDWYESGSVKRQHPANFEFVTVTSQPALIRELKSSYRISEEDIEESLKNMFYFLQAKLPRCLDFNYTTSFTE